MSNDHDWDGVAAQQQTHVTKIPACMDGVAGILGTTGASERNFAYVQLGTACLQLLC